jgi:hypothetical protein
MPPFNETLHRNPESVGFYEHGNEPLGSIKGEECLYQLSDSLLLKNSAPWNWYIFSSPPCPDRLYGPSRLLASGYGALSLRVKRSGREAEHFPQSSAEVKIEWICTSPAPIRLHGVVLD